jgi:hypothetical protein
MLPISAWGLARPSWPRSRSCWSRAACCPSAADAAPRHGQVGPAVTDGRRGGDGRLRHDHGAVFGATISGMLTTIPTVAAVMALFTHAQEGPDRTIGVMRGMTHGLLGFASFLTVVAATLVPLGIAVRRLARSSARAAEVQAA